MMPCVLQLFDCDVTVLSLVFIRCNKTTRDVKFEGRPDSWISRQTTLTVRWLRSAGLTFPPLLLAFFVCRF